MAQKLINYFATPVQFDPAKRDYARSYARWVLPPPELASQLENWPPRKVFINLPPRRDIRVVNVLSVEEDSTGFFVDEKMWYPNEHGVYVSGGGSQFHASKTPTGGYETVGSAKGYLFAGRVPGPVKQALIDLFSEELEKVRKEKGMKFLFSWEDQEPRYPESYIPLFNTIHQLPE
ncbi:MAG: hypothetical protein HY051_05605 [Candidatus Aenigmarchaeota archaeon]|nr:hypothetical protein [Candidatus Aenigmarchaeota archaeon]